MAIWSKGTIRKWDDLRGFGFIAPDGGGQDVFFHISSLANRNRRPEGNESVTYTTELGVDRRLRAGRVHYGHAPPSPVRNRVALGGAFLLATSIAAMAGRFPGWLPAVYLLVSLVTFTMYRSDKARAQNGRWRIPEGHLHFWELMGGWPGALVARQYYRHKSRKLSFRAVSWTIVLLHIGALGWYAYVNPRWF